MKLGLLVCDHVSSRHRHIAGDYPEMFAALFRRRAPDFDLVGFDVCRDVLPSHPEACDAYLCTGSRFSSYDDLPWIHALKDFLRRLHEGRRPYVGICFGHQVLAEALGGEVASAETGWGVGVHAIDVLREEAWMRLGRARIRLPHMHRDQVVRLPEGAELLGRSDHCLIAAFGVGTTMLGIQAHPEFPPALSEALIRDRVEQIGAERADAGLRSLKQSTDEVAVARWIADFCRHGYPPR